jgi:tetratricopeptide (TPR) repeat protein
MRLPGITHPPAIDVRATRPLALGLLFVSTAFWLSPGLAQGPVAGQDRGHDTAQWRQIEEHMPNPATATAAALEQQADILRARRYPADALDYYKYAMTRGGSPSKLTNKMGLTELEMHNVELARAYFQRSLKLNRKDADTWNNMGAVEYLDRGAVAAVTDYKKAIKLNKHQAVFHANLATADFETKDYNGARHEMGEALELDPSIFDKEISTGGVAAHVLTSEDRARMSFEMARMYAHNGQQEEMLHSLSQAAEAGMDVQREMVHDPVLAKYQMDPRVVTLVHNAQVLRTGHVPTVSASSAGSADSAAPAAKPMIE